MLRELAVQGNRFDEFLVRALPDYAAVVEHDDEV